MSEIKIKLAAGTNVGLIRQNNEDNFVVCPDLSKNEWLIPQGTEYIDESPYGALLVVADGMGGANAGEVASAIAVQTIQDEFLPERVKELVDNETAILKFMMDVVKTADLKILERSQSDSSTQGMGTTVVMAWVLGNKAYVCWCGDSRCYALNRQNGLVQVSKDHSYVQELVDRGELQPEYMHDHPLSNIITRCLGDAEKRALPETRIYNLYDGDTILLCSDGLSGLVYDDDIAAILGESNMNLMECKNDLIDAALEGGGHDNVTVALCTVQMSDTTIRPLRPPVAQKDKPGDQTATPSNEEENEEATIIGEAPAKDDEQTADKATAEKDEDEHMTEESHEAEEEKAEAGTDEQPVDGDKEEYTNSNKEEDADDEKKEDADGDDEDADGDDEDADDDDEDTDDDDEDTDDDDEYADDEVKDGNKKKDKKKKDKKKKNKTASTKKGTKKKKRILWKKLILMLFVIAAIIAAIVWAVYMQFLS